MRRILVGMLAALLFGFSAMSQATAEARGKRFYDGLKNPGQLAQLIETALANHPSGEAMIDPTRCTPPHWSCAAPVDYLNVIRKFDPGASVNGEQLVRVNQLPAFLRKLVVRSAPSGAYWMACLTKASPDNPAVSGYTPIANCVVRKFHPGEKAWVDPDTNKIVLAQDCTNPVGRPEQFGGCVYLRYWTHPELHDLAVHVKQYGDSDASFDEDCPPAILRAGETEWESLFVEHCYDPECSFASADAAVGDSGWQTGSHPASSGLNVIRLPWYFATEGSSYRLFLCLLRDTGDQTCGIGVRWFDYMPVKGTKIATIRYTEKEARNVTTVTGRPSELWWHFERPCIDKTPP